MNRIEFDLIWWKDTWYEFGAYREAACCVLSMFFPIGKIHRSAVTAMQATIYVYKYLLSVFSVVSLLLCRGTWVIELWWQIWACDRHHLF